MFSDAKRQRTKSDGTPGDCSRLMMGIEPRDVPGKLAMRVVRKLLMGTYHFFEIGQGYLFVSPRP